MHSSLSQRRSLTTPTGHHLSLHSHHEHPPHHRRHSHRPTSSAPYQGGASDPDPDPDDELNAVSEQSRLLSKSAHDSPVHRKSDHDRDWLPATKQPPSATSQQQQGKTRGGHLSSSPVAPPRSPSPLENSFLGSNFVVEAARRLRDGPLERKGSYVVQRPSHRLERTPSIPAVLISRVRDSIHETMLQTSKWPNLVALVQERRQKAASEYLQSRLPVAPRRSWQVGRSGRDVVAWEEIPLGEAAVTALAVPPGDRRRMRMKSDPVPEAVASVVLRQRQGEQRAMEAARRAFRRRSVSDDTTGCSVRDDSAGESHTEDDDEEEGENRRSPRGGSPGSYGGGIICSREDFQAILMDHHRKRASDPLNSAAEFVRSPTTGRWLETTNSASGGFVDGGGMVHSRSAQSVIGQTQKEFMNCHPQPRKVSVSVVVKTDSPNPVISFTSPIANCLTIQPVDATTITLLQPMPTETPAQHTDPGPAEPTVPSPSPPSSLLLVPEETAATQPPEATSSGKAVDPIGETVAFPTGEVVAFPTEFDPEILGEAIQVHLERTISRKKKERKDRQSRRNSSRHGGDGSGDPGGKLGGTDSMETGKKGAQSSSCRRGEQRQQEGESNILRLLCSFVRKRHAERAS